MLDELPPGTRIEFERDGNSICWTVIPRDGDAELAAARDELLAVVAARPMVAVLDTKERELEALRVELTPYLTPEGLAVAEEFASEGPARRVALQEAWAASRPRPRDTRPWLRDPHDWLRDSGPG